MTTVCSPNNSCRSLLCVDSQVQETEGKETFICPLSTLWALPSERHKWSVAGDGRAEREKESERASERGRQASSPSRLGSCSRRKPGAEPLCICVSTLLLSVSAPTEMHSRHKQPQAGLLQGRLDLLLVQFTAQQPWLPQVLSSRTADCPCCPWLLLTPNVVLGPEWQPGITMQGKIRLISLWGPPADRKQTLARSAEW